MRPQIRFKEFTDDWEEKKLGELAEYKRGPFGSALKKSLFDKLGEYVVYEQNNAIYKNKDTELIRKLLKI